MSDQRENNNIGEQVKEALSEAIQSGDFRQLNGIVAETVNSAINEAKWQMKVAADEIRKTAEDFKGGNNGDFIRNPGFKGTFHYKKGPEGPRKDTFHYKNHHNAEAAGNQEGRHTQHIEPRVRKAKLKAKKVGSVAGTLMMVFGGIGVGLASIPIIVMSVIMIIEQSLNLLLPVSLVAAIFMLFIFMINGGKKKKNRLKRADRYISLCGEKRYIAIEELAMNMGKSKRFIIKDIKKMLQMGIIPEGYLDEEKTCLMLDNETYRHYLNLRRDRMSLEEERAKASVSPSEVTESQTADNQDANNELEAMMREGQECIRKLRDYNDNIGEESISRKLFRLENLLKEIFDRVAERPQQAPQMHKFMDYYLPTTLKLVQAYKEFDSISVPGEDINTAKMEIEKTLDTINKAFAELLNNLYREAVFDATTDAQVLQSMLAREGLMNEMEKEPELVAR